MSDLFHQRPVEAFRGQWRFDLVFRYIGYLQVKKFKKDIKMGYTHMYTHMSATDIYTYVFIDMCVYTQNR